MSLQIWLPLNGDFHNQGLSGDFNFTTTGTISDQFGKIGMSKGFNASNVIAPYNFTLGTQASFCCWVYYNALPASGSNDWIFDLASASGYAKAVLGLSTGNTTLAVMVGGKYDSSYTHGFETKHWYHIAFAWNNSEGKLYIDGKLKHTYTNLNDGTLKTSSKISLGSNVANSATKLNGRINDVRIYDHCLSAKEVEEIAKGLILHYKLDNNGMGGENLFIGSAYTPADIANFVRNNSTDWTKPLRFYNGSANIHSFANGIDTITLNSTANLGIAFMRSATEINLDTNSQYTISCEAQCSSTSKPLCIGLSYYTTDNAWVWRGGTNGQNFSEVNTWQKFTLTFTPDSNTQYICYCFTVATGGNNTLKIRNCKLEKGSVATIWSPAKSELGVMATTVYDSSGYNNNGTIVGNLTAAAGSPRYDVATDFVKTSYIKNDNFIYGSIKWSVSLWYFKPTAPSGYESLFSLSKNDGSDKNKKIAIIPNSSYIWFKCESGSGTLNSIQLNKWTHLVLTSEGKVYENGVEKLSITPGTGLTDCTDLVIGARSSADNIVSVSVPYEGKISDVRMYAIALTPDQILELYNTSATIDKSGNVYAREFKEQ